MHWQPVASDFNIKSTGTLYSTMQVWRQMWLFRDVFWIVYKIMTCWKYFLELPRWNNLMSEHNIHFYHKLRKNIPKSSLNICFLRLSEEFLWDAKTVNKPSVFTIEVLQYNLNLRSLQAKSLEFGHVKRKSVNMHKISRFRSSYACAKYRQGLCSTSYIL